MWKKHKNKPHSVTMEIRGNKGLFAYFHKFISIIIDENSGIIKIVINIQINNKLTEYQKKLLPLKIGPYLIIDKPTEPTYILKDNSKEQITIPRNHIVPYYPKEKRIKIELQNYLLTNEIPTFSMTKKQKQPKT